MVSVNIPSIIDSRLETLKEACYIVSENYDSRTILLREVLLCLAPFLNRIGLKFLLPVFI